MSSPTRQARLRWPIRCLAVDFGGTLARPGPRVSGAVVAGVLRDRFQMDPPPHFAQVFDQQLRDRAGSSALTDVVAAAYEICQPIPVPPDHVIEAVFEILPDAAVDPRCGQALRRITTLGVRCVLACDTQRTLRARQRTLEAAGIAELFDGLVLSSDVGVRKPHPDFYARVLAEACCPPDQVLFAGDTPAKDVLAPLRYGMQAVLVSPAGDAAGSGVPAEVTVIADFTALPDLLAEAADGS